MLTYQDEKAIDRTAKAARTAATSLEAIEVWARRTFYAALTTAVFVGGTCLFGAWKYWQVTSAMEQASTRLSASASVNHRNSTGSVRIP